MNKILIAGLTLFMASAVLAPTSASADTKGCVRPILHRGWTDARTDEDTLAAIRKSRNYGPAEIDVRLTKDDKFILMHDKGVNRMTDGSGLVIDMTWDQIKRLRTEPNGQRVPSFQQAVRVANHNGVNLVVELKQFQQWTPALLQDVSRIAKNARVKIYLGGRGNGFERNLPQYGALIYWRPLRDVESSPAEAKLHHADMVMDLDYNFTRKRVSKLENHGFVTAVRLTDNFAKAQRLGVSYALTNKPQKAKNFCHG